MASASSPLRVLVGVGVALAWLGAATGAGRSGSSSPQPAGSTASALASRAARPRPRTVAVIRFPGGTPMSSTWADVSVVHAGVARPDQPEAAQAVRQYVIVQLRHVTGPAGPQLGSLTRRSSM